MQPWWRPLLIGLRQIFLLFWSGSAGIPDAGCRKIHCPKYAAILGSSVVADRINKVQLACGSSVVAESTAQDFGQKRFLSRCGLDAQDLARSGSSVVAERMQEDWPEAVPQSLRRTVVSLLAVPQKKQKIRLERWDEHKEFTSRCNAGCNAVRCRERQMRTARCLERKKYYIKNRWLR